MDQETTETAPKVGTGKVERRVRGWQKAFLAAYRQTGVLGTSAQVAGVSRETVRKYRVKSPAFEAACVSAFDDSTDCLEAHALRRAMDAEKPSDLLTIFLLKSKRPHIYRDNYSIEHSGPDGAPIMPVTIPTVILLPRDGFEELASAYGEPKQIDDAKNLPEPGAAT